MMNHRTNHTSHAKHAMRLGLALMLALTLTLMGCKTKTSDQDIAYLEYDELIRMLKNPARPTLVVDVRSREQYDLAHIPGAVSLPLADIRRGHRLLAQATQLVVYAKDYSSPLSSAAAKKLIILGYQNVHDFRGGLRAWQSEGGPVAPSQGLD